MAVSFEHDEATEYYNMKRCIKELKEWASGCMSFGEDISSIITEDAWIYGEHVFNIIKKHGLCKDET